MNGHTSRGRTERFAALVQELIEENDPPSINQMAHRTRLTHGTINKAVAGLPPSWSTVYAIALAHPQRAVELFEASGYPVPIDMVPGVAEASGQTGDTPSSVVEEAVRRMMDGMTV